MSASECKRCGNKLSTNEIGLSQKLLGREVAEYMCLSCLAKYFSVSEELLKEKIEQYKSTGCVLFV